jgi:hypothetical protein
MTTPETITVSLDWAKKLKEAGWPQVESFFEWRTPIRQKTRLHVRTERDIGMGIAAPTAEEILAKLPVFVRKGNRSYRLELAKYLNPAFRVNYQKEGANNSLTGADITYKSLANAAAKVYCHLAEQKLLPLTA